MNSAVLWIYGLSGSGKTTLSQKVASMFHGVQRQCLILDGDQLRSGLSKDLRFSSDDRTENIRRASEIAKIACSQNILVLAAFITPELRMRSLARDIVHPFKFIEIYLNCNVETCAKRDVKGLYASAAKGTTSNLSGVGSKFEYPDDADLVVDTYNSSIQRSAECIWNYAVLNSLCCAETPKGA